MMLLWCFQVKLELFNVDIRGCASGASDWVKIQVCFPSDNRQVLQIDAKRGDLVGACKWCSSSVAYRYFVLCHALECQGYFGLHFGVETAVSLEHERMHP